MRQRDRQRHFVLRDPSEPRFFWGHLTIMQNCQIHVRQDWTKVGDGFGREVEVLVNESGESRHIYLQRKYTSRDSRERKWWSLLLPIGLTWESSKLGSSVSCLHDFSLLFSSKSVQTPKSQVLR